LFIRRWRWLRLRRKIMKTLFKVEKDGNVLLQDQTIALVPELFDVYKHKDYGSRAIKWIVNMYDYNSPYRNLPEMERKEAVTQDIYDKKSWYKIEKDIIKEASEKYKKLQYDPLLEQYSVFNEKMAQFNEYVKKMPITGDNATELQKVMLGIDKIMEAREKLRKVIIARGEEDDKIHGGGELSFLEMM
jgi:hypothetical protein